MEVENKQQVCAFKYDHLISLIQSRDCRLIEAKTRDGFIAQMLVLDHEFLDIFF